MKTRMLQLAVILGLLLASQSAWSACTLSASEIQKSIDHDGAKKVLWDDLANDEARWDSFGDCVETGQKAWLQIAVEFAPYQDTIVGETLPIFLGRALSNNAENILRIAVPAFDMEKFCDATGFEDPIDFDIDDLIARQHGLDAVKAKDLNNMVSSCRDRIQLLIDALRKRSAKQPSSRLQRV